MYVPPAVGVNAHDAAVVAVVTVAVRDGVRHPLADRLRDAVALALHLMPFAPHDRAAHLHAGTRSPVGLTAITLDRLLRPAFQK